MIKLLTTQFDPWYELARHQSRRVDHGIGACASFVGSMRDFNQDRKVKTMTLEHYPGMTEMQLQKIVDESQQTHQLIDSLVIHRVGLIQPSEAIVLVACWSAHRKAAFDACREIMEALKHKAPFWKKEHTNEGERWVETNTPG